MHVLFYVLLLTCQAEVFNILFVLEQDKKHIVHCLNCARKLSPTLDKFVILNQYKLEELIDVYDSFQLGSIVSHALALAAVNFTLIARFDQSLKMHLSIMLLL